jgi:hypothetical protein
MNIIYLITQIHVTAPATMAPMLTSWPHNQSNPLHPASTFQQPSAMPQLQNVPPTPNLGTMLRAQNPGKRSALAAILANNVADAQRPGQSISFGRLSAGSSHSNLNFAGVRQLQVFMQLIGCMHAAGGEGALLCRCVEFPILGVAGMVFPRQQACSGYVCTKLLIPRIFKWCSTAKRRYLPRCMQGSDRAGRIVPLNGHVSGACAVWRGPEKQQT